MGLNWKVAPQDALLAQLRDYFGKEVIHIEYQVKSKAAKAVQYTQPTKIAAPPSGMSMDEAMDSYQAEVQQYS